VKFLCDSASVERLIVAFLAVIRRHFYIRNWSHIAAHLVLVGATSSNQIVIKFGRIVLEGNTHRLTESDFCYNVVNSKCRLAAIGSFRAEKCLHPVSVPSRRVRQFLIYSTVHSYLFVVWSAVNFLAVISVQDNFVFKLSLSLMSRAYWNIINITLPHHTPTAGTIFETSIFITAGKFVSKTYRCLKPKGQISAFVCFIISYVI